jgi:uncharacterized protein (TIGR02996 family)
MPVTEEDAFIQAILAAPADDAPRLIYADWLEERGEPGAAYLRGTHALAACKSPRSPKARELRGCLQELRGRLKPDWLAVFDQPALMRCNLTPVPAGWFSVALEGYRDAKGTYGLFRYDSLPPLPLDALSGDFAWLRGNRKRADMKPRPNRNLGRLAGATAALGLELPREFGLLMASTLHRRRVRSCTDCYFNWPRRIAESPGGEGGYLVRFYSDSQGCLHWYLYLTARGYSCVVASPGFFGDDAASPAGTDLEELSDKFWFCAPSLKAFIYRMWIENEIWFALSDDIPLTTAQEAYLRHYRPS